ncbi:hypothetical protein PISL3812_01380 [Talaromyces islandicus]|uniref:NACHT domain-containing protein n=1 Tax=Talaromyces islandicus TaxID=28573 RepID=A0A0U1LLZ3_TALIS|nr:hypothetical protein PISL3812_01380 [Talaromyces islandicus]
MGRTHDDYTVAWICALPLEMAAAKMMLEETHPPLSQPNTDHNAYTLGSVSGHNVVVACLPSGIYGTTSAAIVLAHMQPTFPSLRFGLMVGIGGGVPSQNADIRLGDVVVSMPTSTSGGVVQYDYGKTLRDGSFQRTGSLNKPPQYLLTAVSQIRSDYMVRDLCIGKTISDILQKHDKAREQFPRPDEDWLFQPTYEHENLSADCSTCDLSHLVDRVPRASDEPQIHYGLIASGNQVMKNAQRRDAIAKELDILCFEMEAAGLMDHLPCLIIRGICDYCDSHKHKQWQGYAALSAAAYAKSLLSKVPAVANRGQLEKKVAFTTEEKACVQGLFLTDPTVDKSSLKRRKGDRAAGTCEWILETDELMHWLGVPENGDPSESDILWLYGNPGTGKSTMAITMAEELPKQPSFTDGKKILAYFFCDSSSENQRTAVSILRGLIFHLVNQYPTLMNYLLPKYLERQGRIYTSFDELWAVLIDMGQEPTCEVYCIIDALDECEPESQQILLHQIHQSFRRRRATDLQSPGIRLLITSRPYPEINESLSCFKNKDLASYVRVKTDLKMMILEKVKDLAERKTYPEQVAKDVSRILEEKAEGTFLWVGIACGELSQPRVQSRHAVKTLGKMPRGLYALYQQLLSTALANGDNDDDEKKTIVDILGFVSFARRPLTVLELTTLCRLYPDYDEDHRLQFTKELIDMCRLMIIIQDGRVQLLHKSVKDFLVSERHEVKERTVHAELVDRCINYVLDENDSAEPGGDNDAFLKYAIEYWPEHAGLAVSEFMVRQHHELFFNQNSSGWELWLGAYNSLKFDFHALEDGFSVFHAAARWGIIPLISWALKATVRGSESPYTTKKGIYNDKDFQTRTGVTPLEEAAIRGSIAVMAILLENMRPGSEVSKRVILAAARNGENGQNMMTLLLDRRGGQIQVSEDVIMAASENWESGNDIITFLLSRSENQVQVTEDAVSSIMQEFDSTAVSLLLDRQRDRIQITEDVMKAAAANEYNGKDIIRLLLNRQGDQIQITEDVVKEVTQNERSGKDIMALLLSQRGDQIQITKDVAKTARANEYSGKDIMVLLLDRQEQIWITQDAVSTIPQWFDNTVVTLLLDRHGDRIQITEHIVCTIMQRFDSTVVSLLLDRQCRIQITEDVLKAAAANEYSGKDIMVLLLDRYGDQIQITIDVVKAISENRNRGQDIMILLLGRGDQIRLTEDMVATIMQQFDSTVIMLLLDRQEYQIPMSKAIVNAAAANEYNGKNIMALLLDRYGDQIQITEDVVKAAAGNEYSGKGIIILLLDRCGDRVRITEEVINALAQNKRSGKDIMTLLLDRREDCSQVIKGIIHPAAITMRSRKEIMLFLFDQQKNQIQEDVIMATVANWYSGKEVMAFLLDRRGYQIQINEDVVKATAANWYNGKDIMTLLLNRRGHQIKITEEIVKATIANEYSGVDIMTLFLNQRKDQIPITEDVVKAANERNGKDIMILLLGRGDQIQITDDAIPIIMQRFDNAVVTLLLNQHEYKIRITENMMKAAAGNKKSGKEIITLLLNQQDQVPITEDVMKAAAANEHSGKDIIMFLLDRRDRIPITEDVMKAAAANEQGGEDIIMLLLDRRDRIPITEDVMKAAAANGHSGYSIMRLLFKEREDQIPINEDVVKAAVGNEKKGENIIMLLLDCRDQIRITEDVVTAGAANEYSGEDMYLARDFRTPLPGRRHSRKDVYRVRDIMTLLRERRRYPYSPLWSI